MSQWRDSVGYRWFCRRTWTTYITDRPGPPAVLAADEVEVDLSDPAPAAALSRTITNPIDEALLRELQAETRTVR